ncbi:MAG: cytochrome c maturation protein CcmE [Burkholderiaceae bacterium]|nr:MAG: cytochrome c maturation protein CcmE [Burkholderiaceae bacterium]|tara:strand:- start:144 stop:566 length:423 start_codon:yes stop_codon:yes gene_type:complete
MLFNENRIKRLFWVFLIVLSGGLIIFAALKTFEKNLVFFYTPSQILNGEAPKNRPIRIGGMVEPNSINRDEHSLAVEFNVVDDKNSLIKVTYSGVVPDLFKEGKGVVAQGEYVDGIFQSTEILAKHDENYMPPDLSIATK